MLLESKKILYDFNYFKFIKVYFRAQKMFFVNVPWALKKNVFCCYWVKGSIYTNQVKLVDNVQVFYSHTDFPPTCFFSY